jgi:hypothetical protein
VYATTFGVVAISENVISHKISSPTEYLLLCHYQETRMQIEKGEDLVKLSEDILRKDDEQRTRWRDTVEKYLNVISRMMSRTECTERSSQCSMETSNCRTTTARRQRKKWRDTVENDLKVVPKGRGYQDRV